MEQPLVSFVLGSYNRLEFLKIALESARNAVADIPHEIIIVDGVCQHDGGVVCVCEHSLGGIGADLSGI